LEDSLKALADAVQQKLPAHLEALQIGGARAHFVFAPAFVNGERRLYAIGLIRPAIERNTMSGSRDSCHDPNRLRESPLADRAQLTL